MVWVFINGRPQSLSVEELVVLPRGYEMHVLRLPPMKANSSSSSLPSPSQRKVLGLKIDSPGKTTIFECWI